jgi:hypothetical protein
MDFDVPSRPQDLFGSAVFEVNPIRKNDFQADPWPHRRARRAV